MFRWSFLLILLVETVFANGWVSGGGFATSDRFNPWFLGDVEQINYCIEIDEANFGVDLETAIASIDKAVLFWKETLAPLKEGELAKSKFNLAPSGQKFTNVGGCDSPVDISFQLGKLSKEQASYLNPVRQYVGAAVRTEYDQNKLRGKGFIYIAPQAGKWAPEFSVSQPWRFKKSSALVYVLAHELGHVFGLTNSSHPIMKKEFAYSSLTGGRADKSLAEDKLVDGIQSELDIFHYGIKNRVLPMFSAFAPLTQKNDTDWVNTGAELLREIHDSLDIDISGAHRLEAKFQSERDYISTRILVMDSPSVEFFLLDRKSGVRQKIATFKAEKHQSPLLNPLNGSKIEARIVRPNKPGEEKLTTIFERGEFDYRGTYITSSGRKIAATLTLFEGDLVLQFDKTAEFEKKIYQRFKISPDQQDLDFSGAINAGLPLFLSVDH